MVELEPGKIGRESVRDYDRERGDLRREPGLMTAGQIKEAGETFELRAEAVEARAR